MTRLMASLSLAVAALFVLSLLVGPASIAPLDSLAGLFGGGDGPVAMVMREIRLPRAILAAMIGASLGLAGAAMQGYLRNPLAEPGLIGVSGSAALGAVIAIQTGLSASFALGLPLMALAGALGGVLLVLALAGPRGGSLVLILAGIAISAMAGALTQLVLNLSQNPFAVNEIVFWMMGSLADRSMTHLWLALPFTLLGWVLLASLGRGLDALTLGEDAAEAMGIHLSRLRLVLILGTACVVGAGTAVAGAIGFVGLVVPHLLRPWVGAQPSRLLWASALGGAAMLLAADLAVRLVLPERDLKLGVLTALVGAPLFLHLIYKTRREMP
ncbi:FecCD family ABC transporter permease [Lutimaribacter saemankumensis]|uniref:Iron complex transport system permease protein n=1 Tax=Lutimaribacter saemankumensis TaxID=490829 RepID=A0A1G8M2T8_9RHOB|nr:iron ABC transporter permease [Lutimaribacter saemankumensis]SDI62248.1 iron complex transport system permease protein [Lutimaribacter saemankumensis]